VTGTLGARLAVRFALTDSFEITPSITYQKVHSNDGTDTFWPALSSNGNYARPVFDNSIPGGNALLNPISVPSKDVGNDHFILPALAASWDFGGVKLVSNTSYFKRDFKQWFDFTQYYLWFYGITPNAFPNPGQKAASIYNNTQDNFVQEVRLQSSDGNARLTWVAGMFYAHDNQVGIQRIPVNFLENLSDVGAFFLPPFLHGKTNGPPYGPGHSAFENYFGI